MEISSHYYGLFALCLAKGLRFDISKKIAHASQFVDDAKINIITFNESHSHPLFESVSGKKAVLKNIASCHSYFVVNTFNYQAMILNTSAFHFFPANEGETFTKRMRCKEDPAALNEIIRLALSEAVFPAEKVGMLFHIMADTFAHQGFSGLISKENDISDLESDAKQGKVKSLISMLLNDDRTDKFLPAYGHAQVLGNPDNPCANWSYCYDKSSDFSGKSKRITINNRERYKRAFQKLSGLIDTISDKSVFAETDDVVTVQRLNKVFKVLAEKASKNSKIDMWVELIGKFTDKEKNEILYHEELWLEEAFVHFDSKKFTARTVENAQLRPDYETSSWFQFVLAQKWYKKLFIEKNAGKGLIIPV